MIDEVSFDQTTFSPAPQRFEGGTPNVAGAIGQPLQLNILLNST